MSGHAEMTRVGGSRKVAGFQGVTLRWSGGDISYRQSDSWKNDATCQDLPQEVFFYLQIGDFEQRIKSTKIRRMNEDNYAYAKGVCAKCPVRKQCLDTADPLDLYWTTRGGQRPKAIDDQGRRPPLSAMPKDNMCKKGHEDWVTGSDGRRRCHTCALESKRNNPTGEAR